MFFSWRNPKGPLQVRFRVRVSKVYLWRSQEGLRENAGRMVGPPALHEEGGGKFQDPTPAQWGFPCSHPHGSNEPIRVRFWGPRPNGPDLDRKVGTATLGGARNTVALWPSFFSPCKGSHKSAAWTSLTVLDQVCDRIRFKLHVANSLVRIIAECSQIWYLVLSRTR